MCPHTSTRIGARAWLAVAAIMAGCTLAERTPALGQDVPPAGTYAVTNVNVLPMDSDRVLRDHVVVVEDGRIIATAPAAEAQIPADATVVDGAGGFLLPGLAEMHGHIPSGNADRQYVEDVLFLFLANGITTVRGMQGGAGQLELARQVVDGTVAGPTLYLAGPAFSGGSIDSPEQAVQRVLQQKEEGWHLLKVLPGLARDEYDAMARTANAVNIRFGGHVPADVGLIHAIEMNQDSFDHLDGYIEHLQGDQGIVRDADLNEIVRRTREAGAGVVPTMALWEVLMGALSAAEVEAYDELRYMPPDIRNQWLNSHRNRMSNADLDQERAHRIIANRQRVLGALNQGGVSILMGTDAPQQFSVPGFSLRREIDRMKDAGMTPYQILRSGTFNIGVYFRNEDAFGRIAPGMRADFILVRENPLEDAARVNDPLGVMAQGRWYPRELIDSRLNRIAERSSN